MQDQKIKFLLLLFLYTLSYIIEIRPQEISKTIEGIVLDGQNFQPLPFANISFENSNTGTSTDIDGNFTIENLHNRERLIISYVGYKTLLIRLENIHYTKKNTYYLLPISIQLQEVTVYSHRNNSIDINEISSLSMQSERIREISSVMPDILRSVQLFPGIAVNNEFKAEFNVRGGNHHENLVLVNSAQVYEPFHIKEIANASVGIFNVDLINRVDLITGGFTARYGDKMSSVLNILYREGNNKKFSGAATLSLAYLASYIEGPLTDNFSFIFGLRKSYFDYLISLIDYEDLSSMKPNFYDIQGVLSYNFSQSNKILFEFIHAGDIFTFLPDKQLVFDPFNGSFNNQDAVFNISKFEKERYNATYFTNLFDVQSINILSNTTLLKGGISYYRETNNENRLSTEDNIKEIKTLQSNIDYFEKIRTDRLTFDTLNINTVELKADLAHQFSSSYELNSGVSYKNINYNQKVDDIYTFIKSDNFNDPNLTNTDTLIAKGEFAEENTIDATAYKLSAYLENIFQISDKFTFNMGGRFDYFSLNRDLTFSPRINMAYKMDDKISIRVGWGYFYQSPNYHQLLFSTASDTNTKSQRSIHYILGIDYDLFINNSIANYIQLKAEFYYKDYKNLISSNRGVFERIIYSRKNDAVGSAKGIDLQMKINLSQIYFWLSYGLLFANEDKLDDNLGMYPRYTDQRHTVAAAVNFNAAEGLNFTVKAFYGSGFPYTPRKAIFRNNMWEWQIERTHSATLPPYRRVDIRVGKDFNLSSASKINLYLEVSNVFNFRNIQGYNYKTPGFNEPKPEEITLWPILPSIGIRYSF